MWQPTRRDGRNCIQEPIDNITGVAYAFGEPTEQTIYNTHDNVHPNARQGGSLVLFAEHGEEWLGIPGVFA